MNGYSARSGFARTLLYLALQSACAPGQVQMDDPSAAASAAPVDSSAPPAAPVPGTALATSALYTPAMLQQDIANVLTSRPAGVSGRALGNTVHVALWTAAKQARLYDAILTAHASFFPQMPLLEFAHLVLCEGAQESTGDYTQGVTGGISYNDHTGQGFLQVTPATVVADYANYGTPVKDAAGLTLLDPAQALHFDLADPAVNTMLWAWYTKNSVTYGVSLAEAAHALVWHVTLGGVTRDYGNIMFDWLAGPHNDRHKNGAGFVDYQARILDYWLQSRFGTQDRFNQLLNTPLGASPVDVAF